MIFGLINFNSLFAQNFSKFYFPNSPYEFKDQETYILQKFYPSTTYNITGTIMVQRVVDPNTLNDPIQISLLDNNGTFVTGFGIFENEAGAFIPTCAAYNESKEEYCIAGINVGTGISNSVDQAWFLFLDKDLNVINAYIQDGDLTSVTTGTDRNLYVTDITSSLQGNGDFLYVGVAGNTTDPTPDYVNTTTTERALYVGYASPGGIGATRALDFGPSADNTFFPSRVIEVPMPNPDGGFLVTGSGPQRSIFFTRVDYNLADNGQTETLTTGTGGIYAGDLYFNKYESEVWFAGTEVVTDRSSLIFQKLVNLTSTGITLWNNIDLCPSCFGIMVLGDHTYVKVAKIMETTKNEEAVIASNIYESNFYTTPYNSYMYPALNRISYSTGGNPDFDLENFSLNQYYTLYTYPRVVGGNVGLGNSASYLSYFNLFYPQHNAHFSTFNEDYLMGSSTFDPLNPITPPEMIGLTRTDNYYENDCNYEEQDLPAATLFFGTNPLSPSSYTDNHTETPLSQSTYTISVVSNDCIDDIEFKNNDVLSQSESTSFDILATSTSLIIRGNQPARYNLYNSVGGLVTTGEIHNGYEEKNINGIVTGVYMIELLENNGHRIQVKKIIIH